jgi:hypothetical protein
MAAMFVSMVHIYVAKADMFVALAKIFVAMADIFTDLEGMRDIPEVKPVSQVNITTGY